MLPEVTISVELAEFYHREMPLYGMRMTGGKCTHAWQRVSRPTVLSMVINTNGRIQYASTALRPLVG